MRCGNWSLRQHSFVDDLEGRAVRMREKPTCAERAMARVLAKRRETWQRQAVVVRYIADFYCAAKRVIIEVDGKHHQQDRRFWADRRRDAALLRYGIRTIRIPAMRFRHIRWQRQVGEWDRFLAWLEGQINPPTPDTPPRRIRRRVRED